MPELPEIETVLNGIKPHIIHQQIKEIIIRHPTLRWPVPKNLSEKLVNQKINNIHRRAKYLLIEFEHGTLIIHLGMSGSLRILTHDFPPKKHDHADIKFSNQTILRFNDPRRFGAILWTDEPISSHPLIKNLGPEPLEKSFTGKSLFDKAKSRKISVKNFLMNNAIVVGVGNIYAAEALFMAKIHPETLASKISLKRYQLLAESIKKILREAIKQGGTTLKDFINSDGKPGYFTQFLKVYGRAGLPCVICKTKLKNKKIGQRSTVFCEQCQHK